MSRHQRWLQDEAEVKVVLSHLIWDYFPLGLRHWEILILINVDDTDGSMWTLWRHLRSLFSLSCWTSLSLNRPRTLHALKCIQAGLCVNGAVDGFSRTVIWFHGYGSPQRLIQRLTKVRSFPQRWRHIEMEPTYSKYQAENFSSSSTEQRSS